MKAPASLLLHVDNGSVFGNAILTFVLLGSYDRIASGLNEYGKHYPSPDDLRARMAARRDSGNRPETSYAFPRSLPGPGKLSVVPESRTVRMVSNHPVAIHGLCYRFDLAAASSAV